MTKNELRLKRREVKKKVPTDVPVAKMPKPPALDTAATNFGVEIQLIPGRMMGCWIPSKRVTRVLMDMFGESNSTEQNKKEGD